MSNSHKKLAASLIAAALLAQMAPISVLAAEDSVSPTDLPPAVSPSDAPTFHEALKDELEFFTAVLPSYNTTTEENVISSGICGENATHTKKATYMLTSDGVLTISGETFMTSWQSPSETPWYDYRASIKSVQIDNGITHIGAYAFADCTNLTSVTISDSVHEIDKKAFSNCTSLREITIPASVHVIGVEAFRESGLTSVNILGGLYSSIANSRGIFRECTELSHVYIYDTDKIFDEMFYGCTKLTGVHIPLHVNSIGASAFGDCSSLKEIVLPAQLLNSIGSYAFANSGLTDIYYGGREDDWRKITISANNELIQRIVNSDEHMHYRKWTIPDAGKCGPHVNYTVSADGVLTLSGYGETFDYDSAGGYAPWGSYRDKIKSVEFSSDSNISQLGYGIFQGFTKATAVTIPDTVTTIKDYAFGEWYSLESVVIPNSVTVLPQSVFTNCGKLANVTLPKNLTSIGDYAFNSNAITEIAFPNTLTTIKSYAFNNTKLTSLTIPDSVTTIEQTAFGYCEQLESVTLPNALPSIEYGTFIDCKSLKTITIPRSVTSIAKNAFGNDTGEAPPLTDVYYGGSEYDWSRIAIDSGNDALTNATIHYTEYDVNPNVNGAASKMYEPWGLRYFATFDGADSDKIADRGIAILKDTNYTEGMTPEAFCADTHAFVFRESAGKVAFDSQFNAYYATLEEGIYSYDIAAKYYVVPFTELTNGETVYGSIKSNSMENVMNTNLTRDDVPDTEKAVTRCILALKESVAAHYAAEGIPGASADLTIPRGSSQTAASTIKTIEQSGVTPNIYAGASRLIEPWGLRYFASYAGSTDNVKQHGVVILKETDYQASYATSPDSMRLNASAYVFRDSDGTLLTDDNVNYYATVSKGISSENISDVYYVVPFVVLNDGSYVYGQVKSNSMLNIMNANLQGTSVSDTERAVASDIVALYNAVKAHYAS